MKCDFTIWHLLWMSHYYFFKISMSGNSHQEDESWLPISLSTNISSDLCRKCCYVENLFFLCVCVCDSGVIVKLPVCERKTQSSVNVQVVTLCGCFPEMWLFHADNSYLMIWLSGLCVWMKSCTLIWSKSYRSVSLLCLSARSSDGAVQELAHGCHRDERGKDYDIYTVNIVIRCIIQRYFNTTSYTSAGSQVFM